MTARGFTAGAVVVALGLTPVLLLEWLREEGTVGGIERPLFLGAAGIALLVCGVLAGWAMTRLLRTDAAAADSWATYAAGASAWTVLVLAAPLFVLIRNAGDEGPGVAATGRLLYAQWGMAIMLAAGIAVAVAAGAHRYLRRGARVDG